jgi:hypothetical protein
MTTKHEAALEALRTLSTSVRPDLREAAATIYARLVELGGDSPGVPEPAAEAAWHISPEGRSNSSEKFEEIEEAIADTIRSSAHGLICYENGPLYAAGMILAKLTHTLGFRPRAEAKPESPAEKADRIGVQGPSSKPTETTASSEMTLLRNDVGHALNTLRRAQPIAGGGMSLSAREFSVVSSILERLSSKEEMKFEIIHRVVPVEGVALVSTENGMKQRVVLDRSVIIMVAWPRETDVTFHVMVEQTGYFAYRFDDDVQWEGHPAPALKQGQKCLFQIHGIQGKLFGAISGFFLSPEEEVARK